MGCTLAEHKAITEAARKEWKRLKSLADLGYTDDLENGIFDLTAAMSSMSAIASKKMELVEDLGEEISPDVIDRINANNPRRRNAKVEVISGIKETDGNIRYVVKYPNNNTLYPVNAVELTADQIDPRHIVDQLGTTENLADTTINWDKFDQLEIDIHKDPAKTIELLDTLNDLDATKIDKEHMSYLKNLLGSMDPKFFTNMKIYLNTQAAENGGVVVSDKIGLLVSTSNKSSQSAAEVYAHELIHAYTRYALQMAKKGDENARKILRKLEHVMSIAQKELDETSFISSTITAEESKAMYDYMFTSKNAEDEFIAHALTNPVVMSKLKGLNLEEEATSLLDQIKQLAKSIINFFAGNYDFKNKGKNVFEVTSELAFLFAEYNNKAIRQAKTKSNVISGIFEKLNDLDETAAAQLNNLIHKVLPARDIESMPEGKLARTKWYAKLLGKIVFDKDHRNIAMTYLDKLGLMNVSGSIASIIRDFSERDALEKSIDWLQLQADKIDQTKMSLITTVSDNVLKGFKDPITSAEDEALTTVLLNTNMQSIKGKYADSRIVDILTDEVELNKAIKSAKEALEKLDGKSEHYYWHLNQAKGLGYYMATGKGNIAQNLNSYNIARGALSGSRKRPYVKYPGDLQAAIDKVATLTALKYTDKADKKLIAELWARDPEGTKNVLGVAKYLAEESELRVFKNQKGFMTDGYTKEIFDDRIALEVAKVTDEQEMKAKGYTKVTDLKGSDLVSLKDGFALYKSNSYANSNWHRSTTRLTKTHTRGTSLKDLYYSEEDPYNYKKFVINKNEIHVKRYELVSQMTKGEIDFKEVPNDLVPVVDLEGDAADYRYTMDRSIKKKLLSQNTKASDVLGATRGSIVDKEKTLEHNKNVLKLIKEDAAENYIPNSTIGKEGIEYVLISENSKVEEYRELWKILPKEFKKEALRNEEKGLPVRKDMLHNYFGYREISFAQFPYLTKIMPAALKNAIKVAEYIWQEFIKIAKVDILIKMPFVIVANIFSNIVFALSTGTSPTEIFKMYSESTKDVRNYLKKHREMLTLMEQVAAGSAKPGDKKRAEMLYRELKRSPIHELYELGVYQAIVEDVNKEELSSTNKLKRMYKDKVEGVPKIVKDGINWAYLTEETQYYKFMSEVLQMSDLVARDVENRRLKKVISLQAQGKKPLPTWYLNHLEESDEPFAQDLVASATDHTDRKRVMSTKEKAYFTKVAGMHRRNSIQTAFVNYNKISGPMEEYLNKMGFIMFTKYAKRIQRVIGETGLRYPLKSLLLLLTDMHVLDMDTIQDQSIFTRSWYNMTPQYPWERILEVMTPALVQMPNHLGF